MRILGKAESMGAIEIVDAYTHCGLRKYQPITKVRCVMKFTGVGSAVLIQHLGEYDNAYIGKIAADDPDHFAAVCVVDHTDPHCVAILRKCAASGRFKGVRMTTEACREVPSLMAAAVQMGLIIVLYAPEGMAEFVDQLGAFLDEYPDGRVVLTHLGTPNFSRDPQLYACRRVFRLAAFPGVYYQVSGMKMYCSYPHDALHGLIEEAFGYFGPLRLCWGSNFPVVGDAQDYDRDLHLLLDGTLPLPDDAIGLIAGANARKLWFA